MHNTQFSTIAKLARMYLAIPASSAPAADTGFGGGGGHGWWVWLGVGSASGPI